jgi:cobalt-zinc-cadmium efflux system protein
LHPHTHTGVERRFLLSIGLTLVIFAAELIGGLWTGSLALLSDAAHVIMDAIALAISFIALWLSSRPADDKHSFGYHRLEVIAALANGLTLVIVSFGIWFEAIQRFRDPQPVRGVEMLIIAFIGLLANLVVARILHGHGHDHDEGNEFARKDLNVRSAFLHVVGDAVSSVGVILAAVLIWLTGWQWVDPVMSILIGGMIAFSAYRVLRGSLHILVEGVPEGLSIAEITKTVQQIPGVENIHDLHVWNICSGHVSLSAHLVTCADANEIRQQVNQHLQDTYAVEHSTLQVECAGEPERLCGCEALQLAREK